MTVTATDEMGGSATSDFEVDVTNNDAEECTSNPVPDSICVYVNRYSYHDLGQYFCDDDEHEVTIEAEVSTTPGSNSFPWTQVYYQDETAISGTPNSFHMNGAGYMVALSASDSFMSGTADEDLDFMVRNELNEVNDPTPTVSLVDRCEYTIAPVNTEQLYPGTSNMWERNTYQRRYLGDFTDPLTWT